MQKSRIMKRGGFRLVAVLLTLVMLIGAIPAEAKAKKSLDRVEAGSKKRVYAEMKKAAAEVIVFATDKEVSYTFSKKYNETSQNKKLVIDAPNAIIVNKAKFKAVTILNVKSYAEAGDENTLYVKDPDAKIVVAKNANVKKIAIDAKSADIELRDNSNVGKLVFREKNTKATVSVGEKAEADIALSKKTDITVTGSQNSDIDINAKAANSKIKTEIPVEIEADANVKVTLEEGSEGSVIATNSDDASVKIVNKSTETPTIKKGDEVISTPAPVTSPTPVPSGSGESASGKNTETPDYTWVFTGSGSGSSTGTGSGSTGTGSGTGSGSSSNGANYTISTITMAPEPVVPTIEPEARGTWRVYGFKDQMASFEIEEYDNKGIRIKNGEFSSGYDMGYCDYYFYDAEGRLTKELWSYGFYVEYEYGDGSAFIVKRTYREIDDVAYRIETDSLVDGNLKTTVADGKGNVICYYIEKGLENGAIEKYYNNTKGKELLVFKTEASNNSIRTILSAAVDEISGLYSYVNEYTYDEKSGYKTSSKYTSYYKGIVSYGNITEYEYYENGDNKKTTDRDLDGYINSSTAYEYDEDGAVSKKTHCGSSDKVEYYEVFSYDSSQEGKYICTIETFDNEDELIGCEVVEYTEKGYFLTMYDGDKNVKGYASLEYLDEGRTEKYTEKDSAGKVISTVIGTEDEKGRPVRYEQRDEDDTVVQSFSCEYNDDTHSFKATYFEDDKESTLEAGYDLKTDIMTVTYKDGEDASRNIVKEFSKYGMQMRITTNGDITFDRDTGNKNQIVRETYFMTRWDDEKDEEVFYDLVKTYKYDETTGKIKNETDTAEGTVIKTIDYEYDADGNQIKKTITNQSEEENFADAVFTYYPIMDIQGEFVLKSARYKYSSGYSQYYEYDVNGYETLYVSYDKNEKPIYKVTNTYDGNVRTYCYYNAAEDKITEINEYTYADGYAYIEAYVIKHVEMTPERQPIYTIEYELDKDGRVIKEKEIGYDNNVSIRSYEYDSYGKKTFCVETDANGKKVYEETYNIFEDPLTRTEYDSEGVVCAEYKYTYDDYGDEVGYVETLLPDHIVNEYEYFYVLGRYELVKTTSPNKQVTEYSYVDLDGILTVTRKTHENVLSLAGAYVASNTARDGYARYDVHYDFDDNMPASSSGIKFRIRRLEDMRVTSIDSTYNEEIVEFLNISYEYTDDKNTKSVFKKYDEEEVVRNFDLSGNEIYD